MARCAPTKGPLRDDPLPTFPEQPLVQGPIRRSMMGRRRAWVLGAVHVAILAHIVQWKLGGRTVSPVEPSESMRTFELGEINAGILFFAAAILSTAIFGRFFCGWGCHVVALQDLCAWIMRRSGIRPRLFRARLLAWIPLFLALYMFVWPTARRVILEPLARWIAPDAAWLATTPPFPGFTNHLMTSGFWATFPSVAIAIPFLLICGFAVVYFLGAKGFCTYGCPYGAVFGAVDTVAPGRIRVNENCDGCAHCTSVCTSNVRVHEEVRRFGMVVDPGCMKCLDCVNTCPRDALRFGFGSSRRTAVARKPRVRIAYDVGIAADVALAATFLVAFFAWRGAYGVVPLLMAVGVALCVTYLAWVATRLVASPDVRIQNLVLKHAGRPRLSAAVGAVVASLAVALTAQVAAARLSERRAAAFESRLPAAREEILAGEAAPLAPDERRAAESAAAWYQRADGWRRGGLGLVSPRAIAYRRAWLALVLARPGEALAYLEPDLDDPTRTSVELRLDVARVRALAGQRDAAVRELRAVIAAAPANAAAHRALARVLEQAGDLAGAAAELVIATNLDPSDRASRARLADVLERLGRPEDAARYR